MFLKRVIAIFLISFLLACLCSCNSLKTSSDIESSEITETSGILTGDESQYDFGEGFDKDFTTSVQESTVESGSSQGASTTPQINGAGLQSGKIESGSNQKIESSNDTITSKPVVKPNTPTDEKTESGNEVTNQGDIKVENVPTTEDIPEQEEVPEIKEEIVVQTQHVALAANDYYQYNSLDASKKAVYSEIVESIKATKNVINIKKYNVPYSESLLILRKVITDYPQFFYVSKNMSASYNPETNTATALFIYYTDGKTIDKLNDENELVFVSDRNEIAKQIKAFNSKVEEVLKKIPASYSAIDKEKLIHDYIVKNNKYDYDALNLQFSHGDAVPHSWDAYGALCEGKSVCEGYTKLFQYLCYCVGINCTAVSGTGNGGAHMWNAVSIDGAWYMTDLTWDDNTSNFPVYSYFNLTSKALGQDHVIDTDLAYPSCSSVKASYNSNFAMTIEGGKLASNYKMVIDKVVSHNDEYLQIYIGNADISSSFLYENFISNSSPVKKYINNKNYKIDFYDSYAMYGEYVCLKIKR